MQVFVRPDISTTATPDPQEQLPILMRDGKIAISDACCCDCGCFLPYTTTIVFDYLVNKTHTNHCALNISSSFGSGAYAVGMAPGGCDDFEEDSCGPSNRGPLTEVLLVNGGSGYARLGRREPILTIKGKGKNANFIPTLEPVDATLEENCRSYKIQNVTVTGGVEFTDGETLSVTSDGITVVPAIIKLTNQRSAPTITATPQGGIGGELAVSLTSGGIPEVWTIDNITVIQPGTNYTNNSNIIFTVIANDKIITNASAVIQVIGSPPDDFISVSVLDSPNGQGATFTWTWNQVMDGYTINPTITNGGSGYSIGEIVYFEDTRTSNGSGYQIDSVDENGSIISILSLGDYTYGPDENNGSISGIILNDGGSYYHDTGIPLGVTIIESGQYYTEDPNVQPCVANVTVTPCSYDGGGQGAEISAIIGQDPTDKETFGKIIGLTIDNGGQDYLVWHWVCSNHGELNGLEFVLRAQNPRRLVHLEIKEKCFGSGATAVIENKGPRIEPILTLSPICSGDAETDGCRAIIDYELTQDSGPYCNDDYWTISSIELTQPNTEDVYCFDNGIGSIMPGCYVNIQENGSFTYTATDGIVNSVTLVDGGKYYKQLEWDGQPSPIYSVSLTDGGDGYAIIYREEPVLSLDTENGDGVTFNFDLIEKKDKCNIPHWIINNITIDGSGSGYIDGSYLNVVPENENVIIDKPLVAQIFTRKKPTISATIVSEEGGGAEVSIGIKEKIYNNHKVWYIDSIEACGGKNYSEDAHIELDYGDATQEIEASFDIVIRKGSIICVYITNPGIYYIDEGTPHSIKLYDSGKFYQNNKDLPPYVDDVKVIIHQEKESNGNGAIIEPVVDDDPYSGTFGQIKELNLIECGENYSYFGGPQNCQYSGGCELGCSIGGPSIIMTMPNRKDKPINIILSDNSSYLHFRSENIVDCNNPFPSSANLLYGAPSGEVTSITAGGVWDSSGTDNCPRCVCPEFGWGCGNTPPVYCVTISITDANGNNHDLTPTYFLMSNTVFASKAIVVPENFPDPEYTLYYSVTISCANNITSIGGSAGSTFAPEDCPTAASGEVVINNECLCNPDISGTYSFTFDFEGDPAWFEDCPLDNLGSATVTITQTNEPC